MIEIKDFYADWCKPCVTVGQILSDINDDYNNISIKKFNIENESSAELVEKYSIKSVPTIIIEKNGIFIQKIVGVKNRKFFTDIIDSLSKRCNEPETGCDYNCLGCEVPSVDPEECEQCKESAEEAGFDYEFNVTHKNGWWECQECRGAV